MGIYDEYSNEKLIQRFREIVSPDEEKEYENL